MAIVADGLIDQGFSILVPAWQSSCLLKVTNAPDALSELIITADGSVTWEYRCLDGRQHDVQQLVDLVLGLLGAEIPESDEPHSGCDQPASAHTAVGSLLSELGMRVTSEVMDPAHDYAETRVTNPAQPGRGAVCLADGGATWWDCKLSDSSTGAEGVDLSEIVATIARVLHRLQARPASG